MAGLTHNAVLIAQCLSFPIWIYGEASGYLWHWGSMWGDSSVLSKDGLPSLLARSRLQPVYLVQTERPSKRREILMGILCVFNAVAHVNVLTLMLSNISSQYKIKTVLSNDKPYKYKAKYTTLETCYSSVEEQDVCMSNSRKSAYLPLGSRSVLLQKQRGNPYFSYIW